MPRTANMGHDTEFERAVYHYCWHFTAKTSDYLNEQVCWSSRFSFMPLSFTLKIQRRPDQAPFYTSAHPHHSPVCTRVSNLYYVIIQVIISSLREIRWQLFGSGSARCCVGQYRTVPHITCRFSKVWATGSVDPRPVLFVCFLLAKRRIS